MNNKVRIQLVILILLGVFIISDVNAQNKSIARKWNEILLHAIRNDFARPTVHARNLYHLSLSHFDCIAALDPERETFLLGKNIHGFQSTFEGTPIPQDLTTARHKAICYASYRILNQRFQNSPGYTGVLYKMDSLMASHNYPTSDTSTNYLSNGPSALGNYIAQQILSYGLQDGANEANDYSNNYYQPSNPPIEVEEPGNPSIQDPNHWQAITLTVAIDQSGNVVSSTPDHLSPEWGDVDAFAMDDSLITNYSRNGNDYKVFMDPGEPAYIDTTDTLGLTSLYKWNFCMVSIWQSHLDPNNGNLIDISPASRGNLSYYPQTKEDHPNFYDYFNGGVQQTTGHSINPITGSPYTPQVVPLGDYARVLAEFWADGIDSETPPGHWFEILHSVMDDSLFVRQWEGVGDTLSDLEYDIRAHFVLGGAMHDAAVTSWSIKGWYDYLRPVSAIRYMARLGQCSDTNLVNFHPGGIPLIPGYIELVEAGDPLEGSAQEHVGKIKLNTWRGHEYINDPQTDMAGVGWILAENWWPYQRPTFVTPPFAGYVSGHSTFSRTAANVLTYMTGSPYFPGGLGEFHAEQNEFLEFEEGPSVDITLQWATYQDAADECSLSRIWGGIHPPVDDIPGRLIGEQLGQITFNYGNEYIQSKRPHIVDLNKSDSTLSIADIGNTLTLSFQFDTLMQTSVDPQINFLLQDPTQNLLNLVSSAWLNDTIYQIEFEVLNQNATMKDIYIQIDSALAMNNKYQNPVLFERPFIIDTEIPIISDIHVSDTLINDNLIDSTFTIEVFINELCDTSSTPSLSFINPAVSNTLIENNVLSHWSSDSSYSFAYNVLDDNIRIDSIYAEIDLFYDKALNASVADTFLLNSQVDTEEPQLISYLINDTLLNRSDIGANALEVELIFNKELDTSFLPDLEFLSDSLFSYPLISSIQSQWTSDSSCLLYYHLDNSSVYRLPTSILLTQFKDHSENRPTPDTLADVLSIDTERPVIFNVSPEVIMVSDDETGQQNFAIDLEYSEPMSISQFPTINVFKSGSTVSSFTFDPFNSEWINDTLFRAKFNVTDDDLEVDSLNVAVNFGQDQQMNFQEIDTVLNVIDLDTKNPSTQVFNANTYDITNGTNQLAVLLVFDEEMNTNIEPDFEFSNPGANNVLSENLQSSQWYNNHTYEKVYNVNNIDAFIEDVRVIINQGEDLAGNIVNNDTMSSSIDIDISQLNLASYVKNENIRIYPNPIGQNKILYVRLTAANEERELVIQDVSGRIIKHMSINKGESLCKVEVQDWAEGTYILLVKGNQGIIQKKLIVRHE